MIDNNNTDIKQSNSIYTPFDIYAVYCPKSKSFVLKVATPGPRLTLL